MTANLERLNSLNFKTRVNSNLDLSHAYKGEEIITRLLDSEADNLLNHIHDDKMSHFLSICIISLDNCSSVFFGFRSKSE